MRSRLIGILAVLFAVEALGADALVITDSGYQVMTSGPNGAVLSPVTPIGQVVDLRTGTKPPVPTPPDVTTDPISTKVREWAMAVNDPTSQAALKEVYARIGTASAGQPREKVVQALRSATDSVLGATGGTEKWKPFRENVSKLIDEEEAKGPVDWPKFCASVAKGLESGAAIDPALLQLIINLVLQIIQLFLGGGGIGGV